MNHEPIRVKASEELLLHDNGSIEDKTLVSILNSAYKRNLPDKARIIVTSRRLKKRIINPDVAEMEYFKTTVRLGALRTYYKNNRGHDYTPEAERAHEDFIIAATESQGDKEAAWSMFGQIMRFQYRN